MKIGNRIYSPLLLLFVTTTLNAIPGNHEGLSCTIMSSIPSEIHDYQPVRIGEYGDNGKWTGKTNPNCEYVPPEGSKGETGISLCEALRDSTTRAAALTYIEENRDAIAARLRSNEAHEPGYAIGMWGDSLTDFVDTYGVRETGYFKNNIGLSFFPVTNFGGSEWLIDSWEDYFNNFSMIGPGNYNFKVDNNGHAGQQSTGILSKLHIDPSVDPDTGLWGVARGNDNCISFKESNRVPVRNTLMIGGNDIIFTLLAGGVVFPFLNESFVKNVTNNIETIVDWHIENGKEILLEGTLPIYSEPIYGDYNTKYVNRVTSCGPVEDMLLTPENVPWFICAYNPGICGSMVSSAIAYNEYVISEVTDFLDLMFINKKEKYDVAKATAVVASMTQACVNDRIKQKIAPRYESLYPENVHSIPMYDHFNLTGSDGDARDYWVPITVAYIQEFGFSKFTQEEREVMGSALEKLILNDIQTAMSSLIGSFGLDFRDAKSHGFIDNIHIGPVGYIMRSNFLGRKMKQIGWESKPALPDDVPEPVVNFTNLNVGKRIVAKAVALGIFGSEAGDVQEIPPAHGSEFGGYYQAYHGNQAIFVKQLSEITSDSTYDEVYSAAYRIYDGNYDKYRSSGGPTGSFGYPKSDTEEIEGGWKTHTRFECGKIWTTPLGTSDATGECDYL